MTDKGGPRRGRQLNPYEVAAIKEKLGHETLDSMYPGTYKAKSNDEPPPFYSFALCRESYQCPREPPAPWTCPRSF